MAKVEEEIFDISSLETKSTSINFGELVEYIIEREFRAGAQQDSVGVLYVKNDSLVSNFGERVLAQVDDWLSKKDILQSMYTKVASEFGQPVKFDLTELDDAAIRQTLEAILANVQVRPAPAEMPEQFRLFSYREISAIARDNMVTSFQQKTNLADFLYKKGVSSDYRPSQELVETAILTAYFVQAITAAEETKLILPGTSKLFTP